MTNYQVRILCYTVLIAIGGIIHGMIATGTSDHYTDKAAGTGSFLMTLGIFFFITESLVVSFRKKP